MGWIGATPTTTDASPVLRHGPEACGAPIPVTKDHPLYQFMRDGDGDGRVCE